MVTKVEKKENWPAIILASGAAASLIILARKLPIKDVKNVLLKIGDVVGNINNFNKTKLLYED